MLVENRIYSLNCDIIKFTAYNIGPSWDFYLIYSDIISSTQVLLDLYKLNKYKLNKPNININRKGRMEIEREKMIIKRMKREKG